MIDIILGLFILFLCFSCGNLLLKVFKVSLEEDEAIVFGTALGLGILAYLILIIGLAGFLAPKYLWILVGLMTVISLACIKQSFQTLKEGFQLWAVSLSKTNIIIFLLTLITFGTALLGLLAPETANDSLCYHVHLPKLFLINQQTGFILYEYNSSFPLLMEMLYTLGLGIGGMTLAKFFHFAVGLLAAGAILSFGRRYVPNQLAWWGAVLFITTPGIINQLSTTYIDAALAGFTVFSVIVFLRWRETKQIGWLALAGIFSGFVLSAKYLGLISVLAIFLMLLWRLLRTKSGAGKTVACLIMFSGFAFMFSCFWYLRSYIELGNPVYPYFYSIFKSGNPAMHYDDIGVAKNIFSFLLLPWTITMRPEIFEGFGVQIGPAYLAFLPFIFLSLRKIPFTKPLLFFSFFYLVCWFLLGQSLRFFFPALPALALLIIFGLANLDKDRFVLKRGIPIVLIVILFIHTGLSLYHYRSIYKTAVGLESSDEYLNRVERSYGPAKFVNEELPKNSKILVADETRLYYFKHPIVRETIYDLRSGYSEKVKTVGEVFSRLRQDGFTHILFVESPDTGAVEDYGSYRIPKMLRENKSKLKKYLDSIYTHEFTTKDGKQVTYTLYQMKERSK